jgi:hypothetical protein
LEKSDRKFAGAKRENVNLIETRLELKPRDSPFEDIQNRGSFKRCYETVAVHARFAYLYDFRLHILMPRLGKHPSY